MREIKKLRAKNGVERSSTQSASLLKSSNSSFSKNEPLFDRHVAGRLSSVTTSVPHRKSCSRRAESDSLRRTKVGSLSSTKLIAAARRVERRNTGERWSRRRLLRVLASSERCAGSELVLRHNYEWSIANTAENHIPNRDHCIPVLRRYPLLTLWPAQFKLLNNTELNRYS